MFAPRNSSPTPIYGKEDVAAYEIKLKKVLGLTVCGNAALDCSPISGLLAYPAGCTIVLFNAKKQTQAYLVNTSRKAFTSVAFSRCGRYVATGECGINPAIKVWELEAPNGNLENCTGGNMVAEFVDHKNAVTCVAFSPTSKYLVSVGSQHDMIVNVFDWKSNLKVASNKISSRVSAVSFAEDGSYFVTVGNRHVKYWYLENGRKYKDPIPLMGRSAILGDLRDNDFCAVACGKGACSEYTYSITRQGHLVEFTSRRLLDKWVLCRTTSANCISVNSHFIMVGCAEAIIRIFNAATLEYITTLPRTHYLGVDVAQGIHINHIMTVPPQAKYPDCIAMAFDEQRSKVSCVYNDHSLYIWDMRDVKRVGKSHSFLYHSTCIWGVETVPYNLEREISQTLPEDSFTTCSSDDTIRVWGLEGCANNELYRKNIYSKELLKVIYIDGDLTYIKDPETYNDKNSPGSNSNYDGRNGVRCIKISPDLHHLASGDRSGNIRIYNLHNLKLKATIEAHESEVLCLEYSNDKIDRKLLASASRDRLIHVFDVAQDYRLLQTLDDHSSSITSIKFVGSGLNFQMISCGADKSIMFRTFQGNIFLRGTHTSGKTTLYDMEVDSNAKHILTACQDRNIRVYGTQNSKHTKTFKGSHSDEGSLIKLCLDPSGIYVATSCTDKTLAVYDYYSNECMARMYGHSELVTGLKFTNDCRYLISASGDGCIFIWQIPHDMIVTMQARLSQQRLRSGYAPLPRPVSTALVADETLIESMADDADELTIAQKYGFSPNFISTEAALTPGYKLSDVGQLPQWAKRKAGSGATINEIETSSSTINLSTTNSNSITNLSSSPSGQTGLMPRPRNRWAQRGQIDSDTITDLRSNSESPLGSVSTTAGIAHHHTGGGGGLGNTQTSDYNSASSKDVMYNQASYLSEDSSIDSGMDTRRDIKFIGSNNTGTVSSTSSPNINILINNNGNNNDLSSRLIVDKRKPSIRFDSISNNDHDGDVEDISDGERTSSEHGMFYNNISPTTSTDFKVTAMNEDELRKSVRRQKFEKSGLTLTNTNGGSAYTASTGTGTGTSDTEDEGSTPSAEHAERSLASTLGGSSESIPQTSNSFLQQALPDSPANITVLDRNSLGRRSISAKHTENGKKSIQSNAPPTITKSYTSTKKEELLKVINEAKQKLENGTHVNGVATKLSTIPEVGYRSLRGSHSISDLSLAGNMELQRSSITNNRYPKTAFIINNDTKLPYQEQQLNPKNIMASQIKPSNNLLSPQQQSPPKLQSQLQFQPETEATQPTQYFFNCAAPKSRLQQNYHAMRHVQQHYPSYPYHVGVYQIHPPPGVPFMVSSSTTHASPQKSQKQQQYKQSSSSTLPNYASNNNKICNRIKRNPTGNTRRTPSILKHYKSCPVSPVHEEIEWSADNKNYTISEPKRHSVVYAEDARAILDMIQTDTEKMIEEITKKYGDLDDIGTTIHNGSKRVQEVLPTTHSQIVISKSVPDNLIYARNIIPTTAAIQTGSTPRTPRTPHNPVGNLSPGSVLPQQQPYVALAPKHSFSEFYIYQEVYQCERKVSLSDILNDNSECLVDRKRFDEARFLETQRHSSASFFLTSQNNPYDSSDRSQESLFSEDFLIDDGSYCNSMESILSDESDCKSAPMETFNEQQQQKETPKHAGIRNYIIHGPTSTIAAAQIVSRSFGNSPNAFNSFDYYMQQRQQQEQHQSSTTTKVNIASPPMVPNQAPAPPVAPYNTFDVSSYNLDKIQSYDKKVITSNNLNLKLKYAMSTSKTYPKLNESTRKTRSNFNSVHYDDDDIIPTSSSKNKQYSARVSKSISSEFAHNRGHLQAERKRLMTGQSLKHNSNEKSLFEKKDIKVKPPLPVKPHNLVSTLTLTVEASKQQRQQQQQEPKHRVIKRKVSNRKSCTFEVLDNQELRYCHSRTASVVRKFETNLQKFEREKQAELQAKRKYNSDTTVGMRSSVSSGALAATTQSCLKKISKFDNTCDSSIAPNARRATSMKQRDNRPKISVRFNTVSHIKYTPCEKRFIALPTSSVIKNIAKTTPKLKSDSLPSDFGEKTFEMFISENGNDDNNHDNVHADLFKLYAKPEELQQQYNHDKCKHQKNVENNEKTQHHNQKEIHTQTSTQDQSRSKSNDNIASIETTRQCNSIKKKIDLIEKLIVMEEKKNEQIRLATESRLKPFACDSKQKGYVKSLTMNFDMLVKGIEKDIEMEQRRILNDNDNTTTSATADIDHLCAYALHIKRNCSLPDVLESTTDHYKNSFTAMTNNKQLQKQQKQQSIVQLHHDSDGIEVELAKEVKADSDIEDEKEDESEKASLQNVINTGVTGITKSIISSQAMDESSTSMRRACSLSDLHITNISKNGKMFNAIQKTPASRNSITTRTNSKRNSQQLQKGSINNLNNTGNTFNQSDSETEDVNRSRISTNNSQGRSNGQTGTSRSYNNKNANGNNNRRKSAVQSNFNNALQQDDSSSEETQGSSTNIKPTIPPRPRNLPFDYKTKVLNSPNVVKQRGVYEANDFTNLSDNCNNNDSKSQVHNVINKLYTTTQTVLQLHANLKNCEDSLMLKELENAVIMTQNMLTNITQNKNDKSISQQTTMLNHTSSSSSSSSSCTLATTTTSPSSATTTVTAETRANEQLNIENGDYLMMVNNCADLLSNFRMKHKNSDESVNNQL